MTDGSGNADGDWETDRGEWVAGTDPTTPGDNLSVDGSVTMGADDIELSWESLPSYRYSVESTENLTSPNWSAVTSLYGTGGILNYEGSSTQDVTRFYRITVTNPPPF